MAKRVQDTAPPRSDDAKQWIKQNVAEQKKRSSGHHEGDEWRISRRLGSGGTKSFLRISTTTGFNVTGDMKRVIQEKRVCQFSPKRKDKVVLVDRRE